MASPAQSASEASAGEAHKARGNELLKAGDFAAAAAAYGEAIQADASVAAYWSNRSHALLRSGNAVAALSDAEEAARLHPRWAKAHFRRAQALKELARPLEAAQACELALGVAEIEAEAKELRKLREAMSAAATSTAVSGWWHGMVSKELGGFMQEFCFRADGEMTCCVYGQELTGKYFVSGVEVSASGDSFRGGIDVNLNEERVPYLFRVQGDVLDLCCPMSSPPERPRTFNGPGHVAMRRGRESCGDVLASLSEGQRLVRYLGELSEAIEARVPDMDTGVAAERAAERLMEEHELGDTMHAQQLLGPETLEDKSKRMTMDNHVQALRVKYTDAIDDIAQQLLKGELQASSAYPAEAKELERALRRLKRAAPDSEVVEEAPPPAAAETAAPAPAPAAPPAEAAAVAAEPVAAHAAAPAFGGSGAKPAATAPSPPPNGCCCGCFAAFAG